MIPSTIFSVLAAVVFAAASLLYIIDVAQKKVIPSIATFILFGFINLSQLISLVLEGIWSIIPFTLVGLITSVAITMLALKYKKVYFKLPDKIALVGASIGIVVWLLTNDPAWNIYVLTIVNYIIFAPLIIKSFRNPELETSLPWQLNLIASLFLIFSVNSHAMVELAIPIRQFSCSLLLNIGLIRGKLIQKEAK